MRQLEEVKNASYCDYIRPPIDKYGTLQFEAFEEIRDVGYYHGQVGGYVGYYHGQVEGIFWIPSWTEMGIFWIPSLGYLMDPISDGH